MAWHTVGLCTWKQARPCKPYSDTSLAPFLSRCCGSAFGCVHQTHLSFWSHPCWGDCCQSERQERSSFIPCTWMSWFASCLQFGEFPLLQPITLVIVHFSITVGRETVVVEPPPVWLSVQLKRRFCFQVFGRSQYWLLISTNGTGKWPIYVCVSQLRFSRAQNLCFENPLFIDLDAQSDWEPLGWGIRSKGNWVCLPDILFRGTIR